MTPRQPLPSRPAADPGAIVVGTHWRITVLTDGLVRLEHSPDGGFEDRASTFALNRDLPVPSFRVVETDTHVEVLTDRFHLVYDRRPFSTSGLSVSVLGGISSYHSVWRYGEDGDGLGGTARTLDLADGAIPLEPGVVSRQGFAVLDDSRSMVFDHEGWVTPRDGSRTDLYVFAYGHGYTADSYTALLRRFDAEGIPFSVAVIDMDWHITDVDPAIGSGWTGYTWNRSLFPDPAAFLASVHERGLRVRSEEHTS